MPLFHIWLLVDAFNMSSKCTVLNGLSALQDMYYNLLPFPDESHLIP